MAPKPELVLCYIVTGAEVKVILQTRRSRQFRSSDGKAQFVPFNDHYFLISCRGARLRRRWANRGLKCHDYTPFFGILVGSQTRNVGFVFVRTISLVWKNTTAAASRRRRLPCELSFGCVQPVIGSRAGGGGSTTHATRRQDSWMRATRAVDAVAASQLWDERLVWSSTGRDTTTTRAQTSCLHRELSTLSPHCHLVAAHISTPAHWSASET